MKKANIAVTWNTAENEKCKESAGKENPCHFSILPDIFITENNCLH